MSIILLINKLYFNSISFPQFTLEFVSIQSLKSFYNSIKIILIRIKRTMPQSRNRFKAMYLFSWCTQKYYYVREVPMFDRLYFEAKGRKNNLSSFFTEDHRSQMPLTRFALSQNVPSCYGNVLKNEILMAIFQSCN